MAPGRVALGLMTLRGGGAADGRQAQGRGHAGQQAPSRARNMLEGAVAIERGVFEASPVDSVRQDGDDPGRGPAVAWLRHPINSKPASVHQ